jgi:hypothetical protein
MTLDVKRYLYAGSRERKTSQWFGHDLFLLLLDMGQVEKSSVLFS